MKKIYTSTLVLAVALRATCWRKRERPKSGRSYPLKALPDPVQPVGPAESGARSQVLWEDDFSDPLHLDRGPRRHPCAELADRYGAREYGRPIPPPR